MDDAVADRLYDRHVAGTQHELGGFFVVHERVDAVLEVSGGQANVLRLAFLAQTLSLGEELVGLVLGVGFFYEAVLQHSLEPVCLVIFVLRLVGFLCPAPGQHQDFSLQSFVLHQHSGSNELVISHVRRLLCFFLLNITLDARVLNSAVIGVFNRRQFAGLLLRHQGRLLIELRGNAAERESFGLMDWPHGLWVDLVYRRPLASLCALKDYVLSLGRLVAETGDYGFWQLVLLARQALSRHYSAI